MESNVMYLYEKKSESNNPKIHLKVRKMIKTRHEING